MKQSVNPNSLTHKKYDSAFKQEAVNLWKSSGKSAPAVAAELGIKTERLYIWASKFDPAPRMDGGAGRSREELLADNASLLRELDRVRLQRDILKKTLGIISEPPNNATNGLTR